MDEILLRLADHALERVSGPMKLRLLLQPLVAIVLATRSGMLDARTGKPPYFWALATNPLHRTEMLRDGWKSVGKLFVVAIVLDVVFQLWVLGLVYPGEALLVAFVLAIVPYLILRGMVNRLARKSA